MGYRDYYRPTFSFRSVPYVTKYLIIINIAVYIVQWIVEIFLGADFYLILGLMPKYVVTKGYIWQLVTYMFLHGNLLHIFMNLFVLYMFGRTLEETWGSKKFLKYYFICGIGAGIFITLTSLGNRVPTIGASGAIYGLLAAYGVLFPESKIYLYAIFPIKAKYFVIGIGVISFFSGISSQGSLISHFGHLGGLLVGFVYLKFNEITYFFRKNIHFNNIKADARRRDVFGSWEDKYRREKPAEEEVNRILDKILRKGVESLTPEEKKTMDEYSSKNN